MAGRFDNVNSFPKSVSIKISNDEHGYLGRECPNKDCEGYFKIRPSTSKRAAGTNLHCAYCGHSAQMDHFWTKAQIAFAKSMAFRMFTEAVHKDLKSFEFEHKPKGMLGIGISLKVNPSLPAPIRHYREEALETAVTCESCGLDYAVFGVFAFCPDCASHNSLVILKGNIELIEKQLELAKSLSDKALSSHLIEDALENCVSSFDGFAREVAKLNASKASDPEKTKIMSFQNLERASRSLSALFGIDLKSGISAADWRSAQIAFMKRHLIAHKSGVVDQQYLNETGDPAELLGRRLQVSASDVQSLSKEILNLGIHFSKSF
jgi:hypothetical protein